MFRELLHKSPLLVLPLGALMLFLIVFLGACAWIFTRDSKQIRSLASLPLESDERTEAP
ncbi:MAG: hypothetical protein U0174_03170 [Polyangiaceae bacterium]